MKNMRISLICILFSLFALLWYELFYFRPGEQPSVLLNKPLPAFAITDLLHPPQLMTEKRLKGHLSLLNIWATWCYACALEHEMLMKINQHYHIPIYSINYKDDSQIALKWLKDKGNPYVMVGIDQKGDVGIDLGIYGTPETFILNQEGKIVYRHVGVLDQQSWDKILYPIIKHLS